MPARRHLLEAAAASRGAEERHGPGRRTRSGSEWLVRGAEPFPARPVASRLSRVGTEPPGSELSRAEPRKEPSAAEQASFLFLYFSKTFFTEIYFQFHNLQFCTPTVRQGAAGGLPPGRMAAGTYM